MGSGRARARARAQGPGPHFLLNIRVQAHPDPSISTLPAPGGRASGRLSSKKRKILFLSCVTESRILFLALVDVLHFQIAIDGISSFTSEFSLIPSCQSSP